ncbi:MAG TPA: hypothetical protein VMW16_08510 [Sedimentisphaerales bacterium]|nr:hypothetical protein [Sedimentisphaerales bacterium]
MSIKEKARHIGAELKGHVPFTLFGASLGIVFMLLFNKVGRMSGHTLFMVFHPAHVVLSAMVTASMFRLHTAKKQFLVVLVVGYFGSVGVATLSDIIIPHIGINLLGLNVPTHGEVYPHASSASHEKMESGTVEHDGQSDSHQTEHQRHRIHLGFIEEWYLVNPAALAGILIAFLLPRTKFPHAGHILVSTWASLSYLLMDMESAMTVAAAVGIFVTLFIAVWAPCCVSDIVFPLLFVKSDLELAAACPHHGLHSHAHIHAESEASQ